MTNPHAVELGRLGGKSKSKAKALAAKLNGKKGGRPCEHDAPYHKYGSKCSKCGLWPQ